MEAISCRGNGRQIATLSGVKGSYSPGSPSGSMGMSRSGGISIDTKWASAFQYLLPVPSRQNPTPKAPPNGSEQVPYAVADHDAVVNCDSGTICRRPLRRDRAKAWPSPRRLRSQSECLQEGSAVPIAAKSVLDYPCLQLRSECRAGKDASVVDSLPAAALARCGITGRKRLSCLRSSRQDQFCLSCPLFPEAVPHHRFSSHSHPAVNLPSRNRNAGGAQSCGRAFTCCKCLGKGCGLNRERLRTTVIAGSPS
jgi:hypothetical protein